AFCLMTGYPRAELARLHIRDLTHPADLESSMEGRRKLIQGDGAPYEREVRLRRKDGSYLWALVATSIVRATDGRPAHLVAVLSDGSGGWTELYRRALPTDSGVLIVTIARDVTERRAQQEKIERLNRVYAMLSGINAASARIRDRDELFRECCRIAHEAGGFDAVSIHLIDPQKLIAEPVAWHGRQEMMEWLRQGRFSVGVEKSAAQSLPVELIKTRRPATTNDALHDPRVQFKDALARFGINTVAFLPLIVSDRVTGVMTMYSPLEG